MALTSEQHEEIARYHEWATKADKTHNIPGRSAAAFRRRARVTRATESSSTSSHGRLAQLTAFPTAVFDPRLGAWQLALPGG